MKSMAENFDFFIKATNDNFKIVFSSNKVNIFVFDFYFYIESIHRSSIEISKIDIDDERFKGSFLILTDFENNQADNFNYIPNIKIKKSKFVLYNNENNFFNLAYCASTLLILKTQIIILGEFLFSLIWASPSIIKTKSII
jgi:hypothetical protein